MFQISVLVNVRQFNHCSYLYKNSPEIMIIMLMNLLIVFVLEEFLQFIISEMGHWVGKH